MRGKSSRKADIHQMQSPSKDRTRRPSLQRQLIRYERRLRDAHSDELAPADGNVKGAQGRGLAPPVGLAAGCLA